jgi:PAS domain S-box-containing protein
MRGETSSAWLQAMFEEAPMAIGFSRDGVLLDANAAYVRLFGYGGVAEVRGSSILEQIAPSERERVLDTVTKRARGEQPAQQYQTRGLRRDGTAFPMEVTSTRVVLADGPLTVAFLVDVTERERTVEALRASEERFRTLSDAAFEGIFVHADGKIVLANKAGAAMYGLEPAQMVGRPVLDFSPAESRAVVSDNIRRETTDVYEARTCRDDGSVFWAEGRGTRLNHQGRPMRGTVIRDITERKRAEVEQRALTERVQRAQKLESLTILAGGVAHDFNNILTVVANGVALAKHEAEHGRGVATHLDGVAHAVERAADLCRQMLAYAGMARLERETIDLGAVVEEMSTMLEASIAKRASLVKVVERGMPTIVGDATQIRQVVMNLVLNASEAIVSGEGTIRVSTGAGEFDAATFARSAAGGDPKSGTYAWLEVEDDGAGMDAETASHLFEPFFTTKFAGRGLGMAAVLGIVRGHAGAIDVESRLGEGTRVRVYLPASPGAPPSPPPRAEEDLEGGGVVLLVDDEKNVRISTEMLLRAHGFDVVVARDGAEAIEAFRRDPQRIDVVLLDLTMPKMSGSEVLRELRAIAPGVPVVLTSGYGRARLDDATKHGGAAGTAAPDALLSKPYEADHLVATLRRAMHRARR